MMTDIEIAQSCRMQPITEIAEKAGIRQEELELYGRYKAKIAPDAMARLQDKPDGKLVLVTAINPTPAGEGKTTTTVGLGQAMARIGKNAVIALREPSLGRRRRRRLCPGGPHGGHQPALHRRYARHHRRQQPAVRHDR